MVARDLLTETGSVFVQIGDENVHLVRCVMDEVFGSENVMSLITFRKKEMSLGAKHLDSVSDYVLWYAKNKDVVKYRQLFGRRQSREMVTGIACKLQTVRAANCPLMKSTTTRRFQQPR